MRPTMWILLIAAAVWLLGTVVVLASLQPELIDTPVLTLIAALGWPILFGLILPLALAWSAIDGAVRMARQALRGNRP